MAGFRPQKLNQVIKEMHGKIVEQEEVVNPIQTEVVKENQVDTMIIKVKIKDLVDFSEHPFSRGTDEKMEELAQSIKENGMFTPPIVRPSEKGYELLAGHRRRDACQMIGLEEIEVVYRDVDDDTASLIMVSSNLEQRDKILPVEKGYAYKIMLEALKRQGKRTDLTCAQLEHKLNGQKSRDIISEQTGENRNQIQRYIRLTELIKPLQERTNANQIGLTPAVDLSYLSKEEQRGVEETIVSEGIAISGSMTKELKALSKQGELSPSGLVDYTKITAIMNEKKDTKEIIKEVKIKINKFQKLLPQKLQEIILTPKAQEKILEEALILYSEKYEREHEHADEILPENQDNNRYEHEEDEFSL